ncbi:MAG: sigma 54-interacting transcriptional regulator [Candidatus Entotheonellia bacterium]
MTDVSPSAAGHPTNRLIGTAPAIAALRAQIRHLATFDAVGSPHVPTVLLQGETGTGKGLVARIIHDSGPRANRLFIEVNAAAIPDTMLEAELFGFEPGAFTDAKRAKPGLLEAASGGTLFFDEIDALSLALQGKLLTAIETKRVRRLGAVTERAVDVKLIVATNAVLPEVVATGRFRADLYHRLAVLVLALPPLRERGEDICALAGAFLQHYTAAHGVLPKRLSAEAEAWLHGYAWPGNVRELSHVMERVTLLHMGEELDAATLMQLCPPLMAPTVSAPTTPVPQETAEAHALPAEAEQIRQALLQTGGNVARAARLLGVSRDTVRYRMQRHGLERPRLEALSPPTSPRLPGVGTGGSFPQSDGLPPEAPVLLTPPLSPEEMKHPQGSAARQDARHAAASERNVPTPEPAWERKPVAVLALELTWLVDADFESFRYDPWTERMRWEQVIGDKVQGFGGMLVQRTASRLVWVFGVPQVLEQLPQRAVHSALAIRQMVVDASAPDLPPCPTVHLAVHLGAVRVDMQASDPTAHVLDVGDTLALPVRLLGQVEPGEIVVTPEVRRFVDGWVALEERPLQWRAGNAARVDGYAVIGVSPGRETWAGRQRPSRSPLVGRERELGLMDAVLEQVQAGRGQVVGLVGAPGMGKSRLLAEFRQRLTGQCVRYAEGQCLAYGSGIPYLPILDLLRDYCGIVADDRPETLITKVRASLQHASLDPDASLPYFLHLLGLPIEADRLAHLSAEARKARTFEAMRQLFFTSSRHQPVILAVENLHWIDPTSEALLASLVEGLAGASILVLTTFRPGYRPRWLDKSYATQIALQPLGPDESRQLVRRVLRDTALTPALEQQLLTRAEGNPFFLEELAYTVRERAEGLPALAVPDTIQAVLAARIDRLPTAERRLLQAASVIGKDIAVPLLQAVAELPEAVLHRGLAHLQAAEFLYETRLFPEREYTFKHALTHEVAYGSLLQERRRALHARIVEALETLAGDRGAEPVERLAHHALQGEVWDKALAYCGKAGEKALARSAHREAMGYCEQALSALPHLPETRDTREQAIDLRLALRSALFPSRDSGRILAALREAEALAEALDDPRRLGQTSIFLSQYSYLMGTHDQAIAFAQRALALATASGEVVLHALANLYLGVAYQFQGDYRRAIDCFRETVSSLDGERCRERFGQFFLPAVVSRAWLASCHAELGLFAEGRALGEEALRIAEAAHPGSLVMASWGAGLLALRQGDLSRALPLLERAVGLCQDIDLPGHFPWMAPALGAAYTLGRCVAEAVALLTQAMEQMTAMEIVVMQAPCRLFLGEAYLQAGGLEEAHALADSALALAREHEERGNQAYALRLLGDIAAQREPPEREQAEAYYRQALVLANELGMRPLMSHCHFGLGRLYRQIGRSAEATAALSTALDLYRAMDMRFWLPLAEAALAQGDGGWEMRRHADTTVILPT